MNIKVLGTGCTKCDKVYDMLEEIKVEENLDLQVDKVEDLKSIVAYGVMSTPTLVINGEVLFKGKVPSKKKLLAEIKNRL
jgi:small redox-active disulfide protein 2